MRIAKAIICTTALLGLFVAGVRASEYDKLTYFTFSGPVQVPGVVLPAGTYMFKLADPESGRRAIQIWDQEGKKLFTTLLTFTDQRMEVPKEPMVLFNEQPSGEPAAVRSWFYEGERTGYEFVYPKDQAMKIARATHGLVLATDERRADIAALHAAKVSRIDESGQAKDSSAAIAQPTDATSSTTAVAATSGTTTAQEAAPTASRPAEQRPVETTARNNAQLPRTASSLPLLSLLSGACMIAALSARGLRRRAARK